MYRFSCAKRSLKGAGGFTLIEVLVTVCLCGILCVVVGKLMQSSLSLQNLAKRRYANELTSLQLSHKVQRVLDDLDTHPFYLLPRIHNSGRITFTNGEANVIVGKTLLPASDSDAITAFSLAMEKVYDVIRQDGMTFYVCPRFKRSALSEHTFGYLGFGVDGVWELQGTGVRHIGREGCLDLSLGIEKSMIVPESEVAEAVIRVIIPIETYYTLYVSSNEQLRYISHRGATNTENQPLFKNVKRLLLKREVLWNSIVCLEGEVQFTDLNKREFSACNRLGRYDYLNFLMNKV